MFWFVSLLLWWWLVVSHHTNNLPLFWLANFDPHLGIIILTWPWWPWTKLQLILEEIAPLQLGLHSWLKHPNIPVLAGTGSNFFRPGLPFLDFRCSDISDLLRNLKAKKSQSCDSSWLFVWCVRVRICWYGLVSVCGKLVSAGFLTVSRQRQYDAITTI